MTGAYSEAADKFMWRSEQRPQCPAAEGGAGGEEAAPGTLQLADFAGIFCLQAIGVAAGLLALLTKRMLRLASAKRWCSGRAGGGAAVPPSTAFPRLHIARHRPLEGFVCESGAEAANSAANEDRPAQAGAAGGVGGGSSGGSLREVQNNRAVELQEAARALPQSRSTEGRAAPTRAVITATAPAVAAKKGVADNVVP